MGNALKISANYWAFGNWNCCEEGIGIVVFRVVSG